MTDLSPQAQAVLDAFTGNDTIHGLHLMTPRLAAALRAAAGQVLPEQDIPDTEEWIGQSAWIQANLCARYKLLAIAAKLGPGPSPTDENS